MHFVLFFLLLSPAAHAATRTVYFSQSGVSTTRNGISVAADRVACTVNLQNQSSISQTYTAAFTPTTPTATGTAGTGAATYSGSALSGTLAAGSSVTFTWTFPSFPAATVGTQNVTCAGSITAVDPGTNPGFLSASGVLITFVESGQMQTSGTTGLSSFGGLAVYLQTPMIINRGRPF